MNLTFAAQLNKMITAGLGGSVEAPETGVAVGRRVEYTSIGPAPLLTFEANSELLLKALSVNMEPIQDLHGQDAPYPGGGGKNLLPPGESGSRGGLTFTVNSDGTVTVGSGTANASSTYVLSTVNLVTGETYTLSGCPSDGGQGKFGLALYVADTLVINDFGSGATYTPSANEEAEVRIRYWYGQSAEGLYKPQLEKGSTATAYAPYSNICPISGRSEVNIWHEATYDTSAEPAITIQLGQTVYGGTVDVVSGVMTVEWENIASYDGEALPGEWISDRDVYSHGTTPTTGAQVCYKLATPLTIQLSAQTLTSLLGTNNVWSDANEVSLTYGNIYCPEGY